MSSVGISGQTKYLSCLDNDELGGPMISTIELMNLSNMSEELKQGSRKCHL